MRMIWTWRRGKAITAWADSFDNFREVVKDYHRLDEDVKFAVLKASSTVVSIVTHAGAKLLFIGSGTIIEYDEQQGFATVLTSATLVRGALGAHSIPSDLKIEVYLPNGKLCEGELSIYDFYYNIATVKIKSTTPLSRARIRCIDDSVAMNLQKSVSVKHSTQFKLCPGERVIALGRDYEDAHEIMASPGVFSAHDCSYDFKELFLTSCVVTKLAVGGPLINFYGEVIGVNFFVSPFNAFIPMNIVAKCLKDLRRNGQVTRPWIGANIANLYSADLEKLDKLYQEFPNVSTGVIVKQVTGNRNIGSRKRTKLPNWTFWSPRNWLKATAVLQHNRKKEKMKLIQGDRRTIKRILRKWRMEPKSPACVAGLRANDIIIECDGVSVKSHLEFVEALWDKEGKPLEVVLIRPGFGKQTKTLTVGTSPEMPRWCTGSDACRTPYSY
ncbi:uncharacterized protein LOC141611479 [Silene latifolia]|uniref:uncharacterized protein LOC141611479 n=1 Tax=Silene latifolia TaxID=37657 RepID=UPI003D7743BA